MKLILAILLPLIFAIPAWAAEHTVTWGYTPPTEPAVVGFRLWRGADSYDLVAEFPGWARGGRWTQEEPIASGDMFTLTAVFDGPIGEWTDAVCSDPQYTDQSTCEAAAATWTGDDLAAGRRLARVTRRVRGRATARGG